MASGLAFAERAFLVWNRSGRALANLSCARSLTTFRSPLALGDAHRLLQEREPAIAAYARAERANPKRRNVAGLGPFTLDYKSPSKPKPSFRPRSNEMLIRVHGSLMRTPSSRHGSTSLHTPRRFDHVGLPELSWRRVIEWRGRRSSRSVYRRRRGTGDLPQAHCGRSATPSSSSQKQRPPESSPSWPNYADAVSALQSTRRSAGGHTLVPSPGSIRAIRAPVCAALLRSSPVFAAGFLTACLLAATERARLMSMATSWSAGSREARIFISEHEAAQLIDDIFAL